MRVSPHPTVLPSDVAWKVGRGLTYRWGVANSHVWKREAWFETKLFCPLWWKFCLCFSGVGGWKGEVWDNSVYVSKVGCGLTIEHIIHTDLSQIVSQHFAQHHSELLSASLFIFQRPTHPHPPQETNDNKWKQNMSEEFLFIKERHSQRLRSARHALQSLCKKLNAHVVFGGREVGRHLQLRAAPRVSFQMFVLGTLQESLQNQEWPRQTQPKKGEFMNLPQGHSGTNVRYVNRACFPKEKHQNSQKWAKFMNFSFWPFLWFGLPGRLLTKSVEDRLQDDAFWRFATWPPSTGPYCGAFALVVCILLGGGAKGPVSGCWCPNSLQHLLIRVFLALWSDEPATSPKTPKN